MTTELEDNLRAALQARGASITPDRLRPADSTRTVVEARVRSRAARVAPILAAAAVVAITLALVLVRGAADRPPDQQAAGQASALSGVSGRTWSLTSVLAPDGTRTTISPPIDASITFLNTGRRLEFQDGVSAFQASYTPVENGDLHVHDVSGDKIDYRGHDRAQRAAIAGVDAVGVPYGPDPPGPIRVQLVSGRLRILAQGYLLTFDDPQPVAPSASNPPPTSPAGTRTTPAHASSAAS